MKPSINPLAVRADDAAKTLGISRSTLTRLMNSKKIPYSKTKRAVLFRVRDLDKYLLDNQIKPLEFYTDLQAFDVVLKTLKRMSKNG